MLPTTMYRIGRGRLRQDDEATHTQLIDPSPVDAVGAAYAAFDDEAMCPEEPECRPVASHHAQADPGEVRTGEGVFEARSHEGGAYAHTPDRLAHGDLELGDVERSPQLVTVENR